MTLKFLGLIITCVLSNTSRRARCRVLSFGSDLVTASRRWNGSIRVQLWVTVGEAPWSCQQRWAMVVCLIPAPVCAMETPLHLQLGRKP